MLAEGKVRPGWQLKWDGTDLFSRNSVAISHNCTLVALKDRLFLPTEQWEIGLGEEVKAVVLI